MEARIEEIVLGSFSEAVTCRNKVFDRLLLSVVDLPHEMNRV
jgi:hypothetical protein